MEHFTRKTHPRVSSSKTHLHLYPQTHTHTRALLLPKAHIFTTMICLFKIGSSGNRGRGGSGELFLTRSIERLFRFSIMCLSALTSSWRGCHAQLRHGSALNGVTSYWCRREMEFHLNMQPLFYKVLGQTFMFAVKSDARSPAGEDEITAD